MIHFYIAVCNTICSLNNLAYASAADSADVYFHMLSIAECLPHLQF
jgi:hypothetical protein